jgi:uridine kinase
MSFKVAFLGQEKTLDSKTKLIDLIEKNYDFVCASVNHRVRDLNYEVYFDADIRFLTVKDQDAIRTYETSLRYLVAMALHRISPVHQFRFSYHVSRSIFIDFPKEKKVDSQFVIRLEQEMRSLVKLDLPFNRIIVSNEEAKKVYVERNMVDKLDILNFRPEKTVHFYECDGYLNYMFGHMVPSTGYLKDFKLRLYPPGILLQYPRSEAKGMIPPFEDAPTFGHTLKESHQWATITQADTVAGINQYVIDEKVVEFINLCEHKHNKMLVDLGNAIEDHLDELRMICIAGPSSSGKTTFANRLKIELMSRGLKPIRISIDDYYLPQSQAPKDEDGKPDLESIDALDVALFNQNMLELIQGNEVDMPKYDFKIGKRVPGRKLKIQDSTIIIIEGIHALNEQLTSLIPKNQKYKIYISPQAQINLDFHNPISLTDLRLLRRIVRDKKYRNSTAEDTIGMWPSVRRGEFKWIYGTQENADFVFNSFLSYELCVMKRFALPVLSAIEKDSPYFPTAERLLRMLKYFKDMEDRWVPTNSLLREFIGDSCYKDVHD